MIILLPISGAIVGGVLGWLFDRRFIKREKNDEENEALAPT